MKKVIALVLSLALAISVSTAFAAETVSIIGTPNPHIEILEAVKDDMAALGYELELIVTADYTTENPATMDGSVIANFFQHIPYLEGYNKDFPEEEQLVPVVFTHFEPMAIYPGTKTTAAARSSSIRRTISACGLGVAMISLGGIFEQMLTAGKVQNDSKE